MMVNNDPYLSFVITARNDDYGVNFLHRMQVFINTLSELSAAYSLDSELIVVEWNPPVNKEPLLKALTWPAGLKSIKVRIINVPLEVHKKLAGSERMPMFEFLAKNVGARRAKGKFVLVINPDIILNEELIKFLSAGKLSEDCFYRINRYDIAKQAPLDKNIKETFAFCKKNWNKVHARDGSLKRNFPYVDFSYLKSFLAALRNRITGDPKAKIHANASGDFFLMANSQWHKLRGYPELSMPCFLDSYLCFMAASSGLSQVILNGKKRIYHQGHTSYVDRAKFYGEYQIYKKRAKEMIRTGRPLIMNDENWGLGRESLKEYFLN